MREAPTPCAWPDARRAQLRFWSRIAASRSIYPDHLILPRGAGSSLACLFATLGGAPTNAIMQPGWGAIDRKIRVPSSQKDKGSERS